MHAVFKMNGFFYDFSCLLFLFRYVELAFAFRTLNCRRCAGIALDFVVDVAQLGLSWGRFPSVREATAGAKPSECTCHLVVLDEVFENSSGSENKRERNFSK